MKIGHPKTRQFSRPPELRVSFLHESKDTSKQRIWKAKKYQPDRRQEVILVKAWELSLTLH